MPAPVNVRAIASVSSILASAVRARPPTAARMPVHEHALFLTGRDRPPRSRRQPRGEADFVALRPSGPERPVVQSAVSAGRRFTTFLFDLDGTLIDSTLLIMASFRHTMRTHLGTVPDEAAWRAGFGTPLRPQLRKFARDDLHAARMVDTYRTYTNAHHDRLLKSYTGMVGGRSAVRRWPAPCRTTGSPRPPASPSFPVEPTPPRVRGREQPHQGHRGNWTPGLLRAGRPACEQDVVDCGRHARKVPMRCGLAGIPRRRERGRNG